MSDDDPVLRALPLLQVAAILFFPGMMGAYWVFVVRGRMGDIRSKLWNQKAIDLYVRLFTSFKDKEWTKDVRTWLAEQAGASSKAFDAILMREFQTVHSGPKYVVSVFSVTVVVWLVVGTCCTWTHAKLTGSGGAATQLDLTIIMALAGAYVWSVFGILSRYRSRDLTPEDLMEMFLRLIAAVPIGYAFSLLVADQVAPALAFASAAFPLREVRLMMRERALQKLGQQVVPVPRGGEGRLSNLLSSLSDDALARLEELHIVTYMDLAYLNPTRLMARTGYSLRLILAWIDQALLVVYAGPHQQKLVRFGIPCALDAREFYRDYFAGREASVWRAEPAVMALAAALEVSVECVHEIFKRIDEDPHVQFLQAIWFEEQLPAEDLAKPEAHAATSAGVVQL